ncbi:hypothetical protein L7F22_017735 [Adiantum nelumboides]|nr:hypothetical protein [Adiantum nelumboides]
MKGEYAEDEDFARIYDQIVNGQRHEHYTLRSDFLMMHGKLCVTKQLRPKVLIECHAPPYARHRGTDAIVKFDRQKAPGLLQPLPIPDKPWESIAMDFIFICQEQQEMMGSGLSVAGSASKQAHFVPVRKKIKAEDMVKLFMHNIFLYHVMPQSVVKDRDPHMTSLFWKALFENIKFSSSFHPQTDGQSEEANSIVLDLLKCYVSEHKATWEHYLPLVEMDGYREEGSSSQDRHPIPTLHEVGESSGQAEEAFRMQLVTDVTVFKQLMENPRFMELLQSPLISQQVTPSSHFEKDLGLDSLDTVEVVMAIEEEFALEIPDAEADKLDSCPAAINYVAAHPMAK